MTTMASLVIMTTVVSMVTVTSAVILTTMTSMSSLTSMTSILYVMTLVPSYSVTLIFWLEFMNAVACMAVSPGPVVGCCAAGGALLDLEPG